MMIWYFRKDHELDWEAEQFFVAAQGLLDVQVVCPSEVDIIVTRSDRRSIRLNNEPVQLPKLVFARTGSGSGYQALSVLRHMEQLGVPVINSAQAIEIAKDKLHSTQLLASAGIPTPRTMLARFPVKVDVIKRQIGFPCVIKVLSGSYGKGIHLCSDEKALEELMEFVSSLNSPLNIIIQEYIDTAPGQDLRVLCVGGRVIGAMKRSSTDGDFRANITRGGVGDAYKVTPEIEQIALDTMRCLGLQIGGIDLLFDKQSFKVCEANSAPGWVGFQQATGIHVADHLVEYVKEFIGV